MENGILDEKSLVDLATNGIYEFEFNELFLNSSSSNVIFANNKAFKVVETTGINLNDKYFSMNAVVVEDVNGKYGIIYQGSVGGLENMKLNDDIYKKFIDKLLGTSLKDEEKNYSDWSHNLLQLGIDGNSFQQKASVEFYEEMSSKYNISYVAGNSLGGGNASAVGMLYDVNVIAVNPSPIAKNFKNMFINHKNKDKISLERKNILNYGFSGDVLQRLSKKNNLDFPTNEYRFNGNNYNFSSIFLNHRGINEEGNNPLGLDDIVASDVLNGKLLSNDNNFLINSSEYKILLSSKELNTIAVNLKNRENAFEFFIEKNIFNSYRNLFFEKNLFHFNKISSSEKLKQLIEQVVKSYFEVFEKEFYAISANDFINAFETYVVAESFIEEITGAVINPLPHFTKKITSKKLFPTYDKINEIVDFESKRKNVLHNFSNYCLEEIENIDPLENQTKDIGFINELHDAVDLINESNDILKNNISSFIKQLEMCGSYFEKFDNEIGEFWSDDKYVSTNIGDLSINSQKIRELNNLSSLIYNNDLLVLRYEIIENNLRKTFKYEMLEVLYNDIIEILVEAYELIKDENIIKVSAYIGEKIGVLNLLTSYEFKNLLENKINEQLGYMPDVLYNTLQTFIPEIANLILKNDVTNEVYQNLKFAYYSLEAEKVVLKNCLNYLNLNKGNAIDALILNNNEIIYEINVIMKSIASLIFKK